MPPKTPNPRDNDAVWMHFSEIQAWDGNPNIHPQFQPEAIAESIRSFGFVVPCVVWKAKGRLVAGHGRLAAMQAIARGYDYLDAHGEVRHRNPEPDYRPANSPGPGMVRVLFHDFASESAANAYALADNELARRAEMDESKAREILRSLKVDETFDALHAIGFPAEDLQRMLADEANTSFLDPFNAPPDPITDPNQGGRGGQPPAPTDPDGPGRTATLVDFVVPMSVAERAKLHGVVNLAKRVHGLTATREAVLAIFTHYEEAHASIVTE